MEPNCKVTCNSCKKPQDVSYVAFESMIEQMERTNHRLFILNIILIFLLFAGVIFFFWYESQFEDQVTTMTQTADSSDGGTATINDGIRYYGEGNSDGNN